MKPKHLQAYLDEFAFRFNRRKTNGVGRIAARAIEQLVARPPFIDEYGNRALPSLPELTA